MEHWLRTDESQQAVLALRVASEHLPRVIANPHHWQWVIIGLHNALQGFMVLALCGTDNLNVFSDEYAKEWKAAYKRGDGKYPEPRLDEFPKLYKKIKSNRMGMYVSSRPFKPTGTQGESIRRLNCLRDSFLPLAPQGLAAEVRGLSQIVADCLGVISF